METLVNLVLRECYRPHSSLARTSSRSLIDLRTALHRARRFVLDDAMSAFLADLATVPFIAAEARRAEVLDVMRHGARLPYATTWIEFNGWAFRERLLEIAPNKTDVYDKPLARVEETPPRFGWLLEEHPQIQTAVSLAEFVDLGPDTAVGKEMVVGLPFHWVWQTTDEPLPWVADTKAAELAHGVTGYQCPQIGVIYDKPIPPERQLSVRRGETDENGHMAIDYVTDKLLAEMGGVIRYAMVLLATLNDVPAEMTEFKQNRGFIARGAYRKYLDHTTVRLTVPVHTNIRRLARKLVAIARRRAHEVRGHWRLYQRGGDELCPTNAHAWGPADDRGHARCKHCSAWRTWIAGHLRGSDRLGFVTHDYAVTHGEAK